jgi:hypothetical protein
VKLASDGGYEVELVRAIRETAARIIAHRVFRISNTQ